MPKKRAASPSRSPVAKRKRTVKATSAAPKTTAPKKATAPKKVTAPKATAPKATASKTAASKTGPPNATLSVNSRLVERSLSPEPPLPDRSTPGNVGSSFVAGPPALNRMAHGKTGTKPSLRSRRQTANVGSSVQPKDDNKPKPPTRVKISKFQMPRAYFYPIRKKEELQDLRECDDCDAEYNMMTESEDCYYHPGQLVIHNAALWCHYMGLHLNDPEERSWIENKVEWYRDDKFPEGFTWDCCEGSRWNKGCEAQSHVPGPWRYEEYTGTIKE